MTEARREYLAGAVRRLGRALRKERARSDALLSALRRVRLMALMGEPRWREIVAECDITMKEGGAK